MDDHHLVRQGVRALLETEPGLEVVGEAWEGGQAIEMAAHLRPDILIVDVVLADRSGIEVIRKVKRRLPEIKAIVLSMYETLAYVVDALKAGAVAYVLKMSTAQDLIFAINEVLSGRTYLSSPLKEVTLDAYLRRAAERSTEDSSASLTPRERQVLSMAATGLSNRQIAERLSVSVHTVEMHRANMLQKLALQSQTDLVRYAIKLGLVIL